MRIAMKRRYSDWWANANFVTRRTARKTFYRAELEVVTRGRLGRLWPSAAGRGLIYCLHKVSPEADPFDLTAYLSITPQFLSEMITVSRNSGLTPVALEDLPTLLADPSDHRRFVCFTLDDGYRDNAKYAAPVFRRFNVPYTIFVVAGFVERTRSMWWECARAVIKAQSELTFDFGQGPECLNVNTPIRKLVAYQRFSDYTHRVPEDEAVLKLEQLARTHGIDPIALVDEVAMDADELQALQDGLVRFGAHSLTHVNLRRVDAARLRDEVTGSANAIERYVGIRPRAFAYPYGGDCAVGPREMDAVAAAGYAIGVTTCPVALSQESHHNQMGYGRVMIKSECQTHQCVEALASGVPLKIRW